MGSIHLGKLFSTSSGVTPMLHAWDVFTTRSFAPAKKASAATSRPTSTALVTSFLRFGTNAVGSNSAQIMPYLTFVLRAPAL